MEIRIRPPRRRIEVALCIALIEIRSAIKSPFTVAFLTGLPLLVVGAIAISDPMSRWSLAIAACLLILSGTLFRKTYESTYVVKDLFERRPWTLGGGFGASCGALFGASLNLIDPILVSILTSWLLMVPIIFGILSRLEQLSSKSTLLLWMIFWDLVFLFGVPPMWWSFDALHDNPNFGGWFLNLAISICVATILFYQHRRFLLLCEREVHPSGDLNSHGAAYLLGLAVWVESLKVWFLGVWLSAVLMLAIRLFVMLSL